MVNVAFSRVEDKTRMHVRSFSACHFFSNPVALSFYKDAARL